MTTDVVKVSFVNNPTDFYLQFNAYKNLNEVSEAAEEFACTYNKLPIRQDLVSTVKHGDRLLVRDERHSSWRRASVLSVSRQENKPLFVFFEDYGSTASLAFDEENIIPAGSFGKSLNSVAKKSSLYNIEAIANIWNPRAINLFKSAAGDISKCSIVRERSGVIEVELYTMSSDGTEASIKEMLLKDGLAQNKEDTSLPSIEETQKADVKKEEICGAPAEKSKSAETIDIETKTQLKMMGVVDELKELTLEDTNFQGTDHLVGTEKYSEPEIETNLRSPDNNSAAANTWSKPLDKSVSWPERRMHGNKGRGHRRRNRDDVRDIGGQRKHDVVENGPRRQGQSPNRGQRFLTPPRNGAENGSRIAATSPSSGMQKGFGRGPRDRRFGNDRAGAKPLQQQHNSNNREWNYNRNGAKNNHKRRDDVGGNDWRDDGRHRGGHYRRRQRGDHREGHREGHVPEKQLDKRQPPEEMMEDFWEPNWSRNSYGSGRYERNERKGSASDSSKRHEASMPFDDDVILRQTRDILRKRVDVKIKILELEAFLEEASEDGNRLLVCSHVLRDVVCGNCNLKKSESRHLLRQISGVPSTMEKAFLNFKHCKENENAFHDFVLYFFADCKERSWMRMCTNLISSWVQSNFANLMPASRLLEHYGDKIMMFAGNEMGEVLNHLENLVLDDKLSRYQRKSYLEVCRVAWQISSSGYYFAPRVSMHRYSSYNLVEKMLRDLKYEDMLGHFTEWEIDDTLLQGNSDVLRQRLESCSFDLSFISSVCNWKRDSQLPTNCQSVTSSEYLEPKSRPLGGGQEVSAPTHVNSFNDIADWLAHPPVTTTTGVSEPAIGQSRDQSAMRSIAITARPASKSRSDTESVIGGLSFAAGMGGPMHPPAPPTPQGVFAGASLECPAPPSTVDQAESYPLCASSDRFIISVGVSSDEDDAMPVMTRSPVGSGASSGPLRVSSDTALPSGYFGTNRPSSVT